VGVLAAATGWFGVTDCMAGGGGCCGCSHNRMDEMMVGRGGGGLLVGTDSECWEVFGVDREL